MFSMAQLIGHEWLSVNGTEWVVIPGANQDQAQTGRAPRNARSQLIQMDRLNSSFIGHIDISII